ncbi:hypothetical protein ACSBR2_026885 [Camellia fascicularis]
MEASDERRLATVVASDDRLSAIVAARSDRSIDSKVCATLPDDYIWKVQGLPFQVQKKKV